MAKVLAFRGDWTGLGPRGTDLVGGVGYYRIRKPFQYLQGRHEVFEFGDLFVAHERLTRMGKKWDIDDMVPNLIRDHDIVFMKCVSHPGGLAWFAGACDYYDKPLILDMDDNYFAVDDLNPNRFYFKPDAVAQITHVELMKASTAMTVVNKRLIDVYRPYCKNIHVLPNYNDVFDWKFEKGKRADGKIVIGWAGSLTHESDFHLIEPVFREIWDKYGEKIIFSLCGAWPEKLVASWPKESFEISGGTQAMRDYHPSLARWAFDIGLAPLKQGPFNECKGAAKWMEYAMYRIPTIASDVGPYSDTIKDGEYGFLVNTTEEWVDRISQLVENKELRDTIGNAAYEEVKKNWQWSTHWKEWDEVLKRYVGCGFYQ